MWFLETAAVVDTEGDVDLQNGEEGFKRCFS